MNIAFHSNQLSLRGTEVALYDYAHYNETLLHNKSFILSNKNANLDSLHKFKNRFDVFLYNSFEESFDFIKNNNIECIYNICYGVDEGRYVPDIKNVFHAVFQTKQPHGDAYSYVSEWLADTMGSPGNYVPHIVDLPKATDNLRKKLNIPTDNIVIGRHGGFEEFNITFVHQAIYSVLEKRDDITFVFMNTKEFGPKHKNILFLDGTYDLISKANFINTCDYMLYGRQQGETFGLALSEFLFNDKPVICWQEGHDRNHLTILKDRGIMYNDYTGIYNILLNIQKPDNAPNYYKELVSDFSPEKVMNKFKQIFLEKKT